MVFTFQRPLCYRLSYFVFHHWTCSYNLHLNTSGAEKFSFVLLEFSWIRHKIINVPEIAPYQDFVAPITQRLISRTVCIDELKSNIINSLLTDIPDRNVKMNSVVIARKVWVELNRIRTLTDSDAMDSETERPKQTIRHIVAERTSSTHQKHHRNYTQ